MSFSSTFYAKPLSSFGDSDYIEELRNSFSRFEWIWAWLSMNSQDTPKFTLSSPSVNSAVAIESLKHLITSNSGKAWHDLSVNGMNATGLLRPVTSEFSAAIIFFSDTTPELSKEEEIKAEFLSTLLGLDKYHLATRKQLLETQRHVRYMVIWSESLEWIKQQQREDLKFCEELLTRTILLTDADKGGLWLANSRENSDLQKNHWLKSRLPTKQLTEIELALRKKGIKLEEQNKTVEIDSGSVESTEIFDNLHALIVPVLDLKNVEKAVLLLMKSPKKPPFSQTDQVYINLLLGQVYSGLEKNSLLRELDDTNHKLRHEKEEQRTLIKQLQDTKEQLLQSEKLASIGQLAAGVAHEINNPIGFISSNLGTLGEYCESMLTAVKDMVIHVEKIGTKDLVADFHQIADNNEFDFIEEDLPGLIDESKDGIKRVTTIIQDLKDFSRTDKGEFEYVDIHSVLDKTLNIAHNEIKYKAEVVKEYGNLPDIEVVESQIGQVFLNLLVNAAHAMDQKGVITIKTLSTDERFILIKVMDTGCGIPEKHISSLFDPFFTTKPIGQGTGLGLSLSYGIVRAHHGEIRVESRLGKGTTFTIRLPTNQPTESTDDG